MELIGITDYSTSSWSYQTTRTTTNASQPSEAYAAAENNYVIKTESAGSSKPEQVKSSSSLTDYSASYGIELGRNKERSAEAQSMNGNLVLAGEEKPAARTIGAECKTCNERKYQDVSNDPGVSFKAPTLIAPGSAAATVAAHEQEHVMRELAKAQQENREIITQSIQIFTAICPECGRTYVAGGKTTTTSVFNSIGVQNQETALGQNLDTYA